MLRRVALVGTVSHTVFLRCVRRLLVTGNVVASWPIVVTLMKKPIPSTEPSVPTRATRCRIPEDGIFHSHRLEKFKSYITLIGWVL
jgi:hypothetical protein